MINKLKNRLKIKLRKMGMLCKKPSPIPKRIRISKTINPDGSETKHNMLFEQPLVEGSTFETELHIWNELKKSKSSK
jgi:hypothetical protein